MSFIEKFMDTMNLRNDEDDYYLDEEDYYLDEEDDMYEEESSKIFKTPKSSSNKVLSMKSAANKKNSNRSKSEVCAIRPNTMEDAREIAEVLLSGNSVIINLEGVHLEMAQRIIDFTAGACYSMDGTLRKVTGNVFVVTPNGIALSGDFQELLEDGNLAGSNMSGFRYR
jgi:Uncharacterized protein conserved in bacteria